VCWGFEGSRFRVQRFRGSGVQGSGFKVLGFKVDGFVKSPKTANFQVSNLIISIGYEIEIREF